MDFAFSTQHEMVRETVSRFAAEQLAPLVAGAEEHETFPPDLFHRWAELGLLGVRYPEADGGAGFDKISDCIVREETSRVCQAFASSWSAHTHLALWPIWRAGTAEQKARYFVPGLAGEKIGGFGLSEPDGGSDVRSMKTRAEKVEGGWRLNGAKLYITNAPIADFLVVAARTKPEPTADAISLFIVDLPNPGFDIHKLKKDGIRASETGLIHISDAFVPDEALLGDSVGSYGIVLESLSENRVGVAANCLGMARGAFDAALSFAQTRIVRGKPILAHQAIAHKLADMAADIDAAKWMVYYGAWRVDQGTIDAATASKVKLIASEAAVRVTEAAVRILGGAGIMQEYPVARFHRDALVYVIGEGTSEIQRNIISRTFGGRS
ncbi:acyl-CoA dehydrogenase family protein [Xanthobacter dioxanivorans]|uniref:Acyl-CoA dehydrogenase family protein n=1 Tax=Xanthobacter dioxanivorans TaxID=2528964 RepID=A0A974PTP5_9HYPH|nr:acyl-CoA dehydrogenase family protein [Xanthobacter dioxanivorans]QRG09291.1 acyl-CoA dehydrogenase family protein [Xanthobacter dioxanivorans]